MGAGFQPFWFGSNFKAISVQVILDLKPFWFKSSPFGVKPRCNEEDLADMDAMRAWLAVGGQTRGYLIRGPPSVDLRGN